MTAYLYYSHLKNLTEEDIIRIDQRISQEPIYLFVKKLPLNTKLKTKRRILVIYFGLIIIFGNVPTSEAMGLPITGSPPVSLPFQQGSTNIDKSLLKIAPTIDFESNFDLGLVSSEDLLEFNNLYHQLQTGDITFDQAILEIRGGEGVKDLVTIVAFFGLLTILS